MNSRKLIGWDVAVRTAALGLEIWLKLSQSNALVACFKIILLICLLNWGYF